VSVEQLRAAVVTFADGLELAVPDNLQNITPYVLLEQGDWFEIEAKFVRQLLQPGMQVLDIGANFGVYTIPMARRVGDDGAVWAFEPCRNTFDHLMQSVKQNGIGNTTLIRSGLGEKQAIVRLATSDDAELNAITTDARGQGEMIDLTTLDTCLVEMNFQNIDFIKLDAEGYESRVLDGGEKLLRLFQPLVMFEIRHNENVNLDLIEQFRQFDMQPYALVPGASCLVPFDPDKPLDPFKLNLFACSASWVTRLKKRGLLVTDEKIQLAPILDDGRVATVLREVARSLDLPAIEVEKALAPNGNKNILLMRQCLGVEAGEGSPATRIATIKHIVDVLSSLVEESDDPVGLALLARSASLLGEQNLCVQATVAALNYLATHKLRPQLMLPCLSAYDARPVGNDFHAWAVSHFLECFEVSRAFSSFWLDDSSIENLRILAGMGHCGEDIQNRLALMEQRHRAQRQMPNVLEPSVTNASVLGDPMQAPATGAVL